MKNKSGSRTLNVFRRIFTVRQWIDWERVKGFTSFLISGFKNLFVVKSSKKAQSFDAVKAKFRLTDAELLEKQRGLFRMFILMMIFSAFIFIYCLYHLVIANYYTALLSFIVTLIALTLAFRYHFWHYQIKYRRLNCSISEWFNQCVIGGKK